MPREGKCICAGASEKVVTSEMQIEMLSHKDQDHDKQWVKGLWQSHTHQLEIQSHVETEPCSRPTCWPPAA